MAGIKAPFIAGLLSACLSMTGAGRWNNAAERALQTVAVAVRTTCSRVPIQAEKVRLRSTVCSGRRSSTASTRRAYNRCEALAAFQQPLRSSPLPKSRQSSRLTICTKHRTPLRHPCADCCHSSWPVSRRVAVRTGAHRRALDSGSELRRVQTRRSNTFV